jgi:hypothetical protein
VKRIIKPLNWKKGYRWICTYSDSADAFGVIAFERDCPFIYVYSDKRIYLNGKYGNWTDKELSLEEFIYIGPAGDKGKEVGVWAKKLFNS